MNLLLNEHEQGLLLECSLEARSLYVLSIRPLVDVGRVWRGVCIRYRWRSWA